MTMTNQQECNNSGNVDLLLEEAALNGARRSERYPHIHFFGYFCSYWTEELVIAAGLEPLRLMPVSAQAVPASLPAYCCSLARGCLSMAERGTFADLVGTGFAHTCDTMQCLGGAWRATAGGESTLQFVPPVALDAPGASRYYRDELRKVVDKLMNITGNEFGTGQIKKAVELYRHTRRLAAKLDQLRPGLPSPLVSALLRAGQVMPREQFATALETMLSSLEQQLREPGDRRRLLISGAVLENDNLFRLLEELGARVVADDTCTGSRHYYDSPGRPDNGDPLEGIVLRYVNMPPCPCRTRGHGYRAGYLERLARERKADGAILVIRKYCEPHAWDSIKVAERLRQTGIKTMILELEGADPGGQERTRLQAFLESF